MHYTAPMNASSSPKIGDWLSRVTVDRAIFELRADYCAGLMLMTDLPSGPSDEASVAMLEQAERIMRGDSTTDDATAGGHVEAWRDAYRSFGAKPNRTRPSVDALRRRAPNGLPRINRITDIYNAISVIHGVPLGVEDVDAYDGHLRLVRASGSESFATTKNGQPASETADPGEPIWRDDEGVTCRRWNWRQTHRTALTEDTTTAVFIVDTLGNDAVALANAVLDDLEHAIEGATRSTRRIITADNPN
jgi:DNA/RNA-binding domain of Phe-tRNA-synthetase-like protein